jgi:cytochrome c-type biogenesis protein CcmH
VSGRRICVALLAVVALAPFTATASAAAATPRTSLPDVEKEVMCPVCGLPLNVSESPQANRERVYIRSLIAQGETKAQIKRALVGQFGPEVLALPRSSGFDLIVYIVPVVVVLALAGASVADAARLDDELARYDR